MADSSKKKGAKEFVGVKLVTILVSGANDSVHKREVIFSTSVGLSARHSLSHQIAFRPLMLIHTLQYITVKPMDMRLVVSQSRIYRVETDSPLFYPKFGLYVQNFVKLRYRVLGFILKKSPESRISEARVRPGSRRIKWVHFVLTMSGLW